MQSRRRPERDDFEFLLNAAGSGSISSLDSLRKAWPTDIVKARRALSVVLGNLSRSRIPDLRRGYEALNTVEAHHILVIHNSVGAVDAAFRYMDGLAEYNLGRMLEVFQERLSDFLAALKFMSTYSPVILADRSGSRRDIVGLGYALEGSHLDRLLTCGTKYFEKEDGHLVLREIVDSVIDCWLRAYKIQSAAQPDPERSDLSPADFDLYSLHRTLAQCLDEESTSMCVWNALNELDKKNVKLLAESLCYRISEWAAIHKTQDRLTIDCSPIVSLVSASCRMLAAPEFDVYVLKSGFAQLAMKVAFDFRRAPSTQEDGGSLATEIAAHLDPTKKHGYAIAHMFPALLDGGFLEIILEDLLTPSQTKYSRWYGEDPLHHLFRAFHHPRIYDAFIRGEESLPDSLLERVEANRGLCRAYREFKEHSEPFEFAAQQSKTRTIPFYCASLNPPLQHQQSGCNPATSQEYRQCSRCKTAVYCSLKCQEMDWESVHKEECPVLRLRRIDGQRSDMWFTRPDRMRYIYILQNFFDTAVLERILPSVPHPSKGVQVMSPSKPIEIYTMITHAMPLERTAYTIEGLFAIGREDWFLFRDQRFRAMVDAVQRLEGNEFVGVTASVSLLGGYLVCAMAVFSLRRGELNEKGKEPPRSAYGELLNAHVQITGPRYMDGIRRQVYCESIRIHFSSRPFDPWRLDKVGKVGTYAADPHTGGPTHADRKMLKMGKLGLRHCRHN
ncbi:hypothetical protein NMY22_g10473 [Coprinellus aureogranulatus]|nr:hypothetical protein NMY22_g10473 [Coprinellus aureogranulatus]